MYSDVGNRPSMTSPPREIFKKSMTSALIGADPELIVFNLPPRTAAIYKKGINLGNVDI
jgi:hypothetical protein